MSQCITEAQSPEQWKSRALEIENGSFFTIETVLLFTLERYIFTFQRGMKLGAICFHFKEL